MSVSTPKHTPRNSEESYVGGRVDNFLGVPLIKFTYKKPKEDNHPFGGSPYFKLTHVAGPWFMVVGGKHFTFLLIVV